LDEEDLLPGQDWHEEIRKAVRTSNVVIVFSKGSIAKTGFLNKKLQYALDIAEQQPEGVENTVTRADLAKSQFQAALCSRTFDWVHPAGL